MKRPGVHCRGFACLRACAVLFGALFLCTCGPIGAAAERPQLRCGPGGTYITAPDNSRCRAVAADLTAALRSTTPSIQGATARDVRWACHDNDLIGNRPAYASRAVHKRIAEALVVGLHARTTAFHASLGPDALGDAAVPRGIGRSW